MNSSLKIVTILGAIAAALFGFGMRPGAVQAQQTDRPEAAN